MAKKKQLSLVEEESNRCVAFANAISSGLPDTLHMSGITLLGFAFKYDSWECLMTLKADIGGVRHISFVGSNSVMNAVMSALSRASNDRLRWKEDPYWRGKP